MVEYFNYYYYKLSECFANSPVIADVLEDVYGRVPGWYTANSNYFDQLWDYYILPRFARRGWYFICSDTEYANYEEIQAGEYDRLNDFFTTMYNTSKKYIELISQQNTLKSDILNELTTTSVHYYHETPETESSTGYINENYTTNMSRDIQSVDLGPVSEKLAEVNRSLDDYYDRWVKELYKFRIMEA